MRKLGVLLVLSAVLLTWGVVPTASALISSFNPGAVVLHCSGDPNPTVWAVSPPDPFDEGIVRGTDCATAIQLLLGDRCSLKEVLAPADPTGNGSEVTFIFICSSSAIDPNP